ncbi:MAG: ABC transporter ATP-binding protein [Chloroflexi bacterium]|nr:ABC transporter ATP-binding protein [Chloroflexota bacterium]
MDFESQLPVIRCIGIGKTYANEKEAVFNIDLTVNHGEILVLLGPSGCGKTTLLRLIAGLEEPTSGTLSVGGQVMSMPGKFIQPEKRKVGMVFQDYALFPNMNVRKNIEFGIHGNQNSSHRTEEVMRLVGLSELGNRMPYQLSGGEQQRTALARALAPNPSVILFDEPLSNLDANLRIKVRAEIKQIISETKATCIFVTHDQEEAMFLADRIAVMNNGRIEQIGTPEEIYNNPLTQFVAQAMGPACFIDAYIADSTLKSELGIFVTEGTEKQIGNFQILIRSNHLVQTQDNLNSNATVISTEFRGSHYSYTMQLQSKNMVEFHTPTKAFENGQSINLTLKKDLLYHLYIDNKYSETIEIS